MVQASIQLEQHPGRGLAPFQKIQCLDDQIIIIQRTAAALGGVIGPAHGDDQSERGLGQGGGTDGAAALFHLAEADLQLGQIVQQIGPFFA